MFIEFAVNDAAGDSLWICNSMEGIVRQIKSNSPETDICFLYTINEAMLQDLHPGNEVRTVRLMENIAEHYQVPSINLQYDVLKLLDNLSIKG